MFAYFTDGADSMRLGGADFGRETHGDKEWPFNGYNQIRQSVEEMCRRGRLGVYEQPVSVSAREADAAGGDSACRCDNNSYIN